MSWNQPDMTRYETRQFAPVRLADAMSHTDFLRYEAEIDNFLGDGEGVALGLQQSILGSAGELAELAVALEREADNDDREKFRRVETNAIRGALSAGWQWWSGTTELLRYWKGERPIEGDPE
ncbi:MAG: hypothetical protein OXN23_04275 [Gammaproteobacteria bacterium]|nr:hypothetical protein [Gammaproteobacteria bacterium]